MRGGEQGGKDKQKRGIGRAVCRTKQYAIGTGFKKPKTNERNILKLNNANPVSYSVWGFILCSCIIPEP